jgi:hypothetical protein
MCNAAPEVSSYNWNNLKRIVRKIKVPPKKTIHFNVLCSQCVTKQTLLSSSSNTLFRQLFELKPFFDFQC